MKLVLGIIGAVIVVGILINAVSGNKHKNDTPNPDNANGSSNFSIVAGKSFCAPSGIDDYYTGDGHVIFYIAVKNSGDAQGDANIVPVRHYDDGTDNSSALDMVSATVPAQTVERFRTEALKYKAHEHEIVSCGVEIDGRETPIKVVR